MEGAIAAARQLTALDPLREDGHRLLMRLLAASGNRSAALKQHERCMQILRDELGIAPDAETEQLAEAIRAGRSHGVWAERADVARVRRHRRPSAATAGSIDRSAAARQALDRRSSLRQSQRRCEPGLLRRRPGGGHHRRARPRDLAVRHRQPVRLRLQGSRDRSARGRGEARCPLCAEGERAQRRQSRAHRRPAHRCRHRRATSGPTGSRTRSTTSLP